MLLTDLENVCNVFVDISDRGRHQSDISGLEQLKKNAVARWLLGGCYQTM